MQSLTNWAFRNKAAMTLFIIITLLVGTVSYFLLPMEFLPEADNPQVTVVTLGQGYDAGSMTTSVTEPLNRPLRRLMEKHPSFQQLAKGFHKS